MRQGVVRPPVAIGTMVSRMNDLQDTITAIDRMLNTRSIAIVGTSHDPTKYGYMTLKTIIKAGYEGEIYPVNPKGGEILGRKVYPTLSEIPDTPGLAIIVVPVKFVAGVMKEAGDKGIPGAAILTGGFREAGRKDLEDELLSISETYGIRIIGPNIAGINYLANKLCAMFFPVITIFGPLAIISQSGTITNGLSEWAADEGLGISAAINVGNQVDLCESDFLDFLSQEEHTKAIAMYVESVKNGRRFLEALKRTTYKKRVVILKAGKSIAGKESALSHTGSLAGNHAVFIAACRQAGAFVVEDIDSLFDCAKALAAMRLPKGNRVFTVSTSGGINTTGMDEAEKQGLIVPTLNETNIEGFKQLDLSPLSSFSNPFDLGGSISAEDFRKTAIAADEMGLADVVMLNYGDPIEEGVKTTKEIVNKVKASVYVSYFAGGEEEKIGRIKMQEMGIPVFPTPERAIRGIGSATWVAQYLRRHQDDEDVQGEFLLKEPPDSKEQFSTRFLLEPDAIEYLKQYNIPYSAYGVARSSEHAIEIANAIGYPVVLKIISPQVVHKTDVGAVLLHINDAEAVSNNYNFLIELVRNKIPKISIEGVLVCRHMPEGIDVIVGALDDEIFGPTIMFGLGGVFTEILQDVSFRVTPLSEIDAEQMVEEIKGYPLLCGARGKQAVSIDRIKALLVKISRMIIENPEIIELDLNPVRVYADNLTVLDVRIVKGRMSHRRTG